MSNQLLVDYRRNFNRGMESGEFEPFIQHIRFPYFKNLELNARIDFSFPITALVGQNGTNKSSVIKALLGCPHGKSITRYWFTTETDDVPDLIRDDGSVLKPRYIYGYKNSEQRIIEILQTRVNATKQSLDYWETSRPLVSDNMSSVSEVSGAESNATRWKKIKKGLVYLDFRSEISAFDRCMYHSDYKVKTLRSGKKFTKQDYIRSKSKYIKKAFDDNLQTLRLWNNDVIVKNVTLKKEHVEKVSYILGRKYKSIKFLEHRLWGARGGTAMLSTDKLNYTEAYAGSGEFAVVSLVMNLFAAKDKSLILLDEPEVSLHPGAQKRMMELIYKIVDKKKHQIVLSTHSPVLVNMLPKEAVKLFIYDEDTESAKIAQNILPDEAFVELGHDLSARTIITEDKLAREVIIRAIQNEPSLKNSFSVQYVPGGAETILGKHLPSHAAVGRSDVLFLLDGDKNPKVKFPKIEAVSDADLVYKMKEYFGCELTVNASGAKNVANNKELIALRRSALDYAFKKVHYLPFETPEKLLIENCCSTEQAAALGKVNWDQTDLGVYKKQIAFLTQQFLGQEDVDSNEIFFFQKSMLSKLDLDSQSMKSIRKILTQAVERGIIK
ncbi:AAA family ATPase [Atlantibacter hermannii]|uniref:ATP-dependent nuclease n=1 Tax=Atlantibacter hermannii TaxID=565 RepID=UPI002DB5FBB7|nr:AAA family ATPase [Atlantibacter hermannii]MEB7925453.1 AAA family ATPase [Atlantibacter hermannii]